MAPGRVRAERRSHRVPHAELGGFRAGDLHDLLHRDLHELRHVLLEHVGSFRERVAERWHQVFEEELAKGVAAPRPAHATRRASPMAIMSKVVLVGFFVSIGVIDSGIDPVPQLGNRIL